MNTSLTESGFYLIMKLIFSAIKWISFSVYDGSYLLENFIDFI